MSEHKNNMYARKKPVEIINNQWLLYEVNPVDIGEEYKKANVGDIVHQKGKYILVKGVDCMIAVCNSSCAAVFAVYNVKDGLINSVIMQYVIDNLAFHYTNKLNGFDLYELELSDIGKAGTDKLDAEIESIENKIIGTPPSQEKMELRANIDKLRTSKERKIKLWRDKLKKIKLKTVNIDDVTKLVKSAEFEIL